MQINVNFCVFFCSILLSGKLTTSSTMSQECNFCISTNMIYCKRLCDVQTILSDYQRKEQKLVDQCSAIWGSLNTLKNHTRILAEFVLPLAKEQIGLLQGVYILQCKEFLHDFRKESHPHFFVHMISIENMNNKISDLLLPMTGYDHKAAHFPTRHYNPAQCLRQFDTVMAWLHEHVTQ